MVNAPKAQRKFTLAGEERLGDPPFAPGLEHPHPDRHTPKVLCLVPTCGLLLNHVNTSSWLWESVCMQKIQFTWPSL